MSKPNLSEPALRHRTFIKLFGAALLSLTSVAGLSQYYSWGNSPASIRWNRIRTSGIDLIYPHTFEDNARRALWYFDTVRPYIGYGFHHETMRTPVVLHTQNMIGNGMVMWAPKRIELLSAPGSSYSEPWLKQLVIHEYRHNVQYNNLNQSTMKVLSRVLGEQIRFLGPAFFGVLFLEGDAVMAETEMSAFGRGLQPSFTMHYRAVGDVGSDRYAKDYWFSGSFRTHVPDHYRLGYQMVRWSYNRFGENIFDTLARYVSRNPQFFAPMTIGMRKFYGMRKFGMFRSAFAELNAHWDSLPKVGDSSEKIPTPFTSYVTYRWPLWLDDRTIIAFKMDFDRYSRIVEVDAGTGEETVLTHTGILSSGPTLSDGKLWWTEFRSSTLWDQRVNSRLCFLDLETRRKGSVDTGEQIFHPAFMDEGFAYVVYDYSGRFSIVGLVDGRNPEIVFPPGTEITGLAWDDASRKLYFIGLDDGGMWLGEADTANDSYRALTPSRHITISDLRAQRGKLYFGSIASGKDEAHCYDLARGIEYRLSESAYGSFQPSPDAAGGRIALTTYDRDGYKLAVQETSAAVEQEQRALPVNLVNPDWKRWDDIPLMDDLIYTEADAAASERKHHARRYRKGLNLFRPHSWLPIDFYPPRAISESDLTVNLGATVMSQNLLSDAVTWLSYGWSRPGGSSVRGGFSYTGLGPVLDVDFVWGGSRQALYTAVPANLELKKRFEITTTLSLPMVLGSGYLFNVLTPAAEYYYTNGLIFIPKSYTSGELTRGVERLNMSLTWSLQTRMAQKDFLPRWGFAARAGFVTNPTNRDFRNLYSVFVRGLLPGILPHHSTMVRGAWQQTVGDVSRRPFAFHMKELFPRGALYNFATARWASGSLDYQFPVWYPEGGIPSILYFKRIRLNLYADYARWQSLSGRWSPLYAYGGEAIFDISPVRMPAATNMSVSLRIGGTSDSNRPNVSVGFSLPL